MADSSTSPLDRDAILAVLADRQLRARFAVRRMGLFGSFADGTAREDSDVDVLVEFDEPTYENFSGLADELERRFARKVDLLTPDGLASIRIVAVVEGIRRSLAYA